MNWNAFLRPFSSRAAQPREPKRAVPLEYGHGSPVRVAWREFRATVAAFFADVTDWRKFVLMLLGWTAAGVACLVALALLVLWGTTVGNAQILSIPAGTTELQVGSVDGVVVLGVFEPRNNAAWGPWGWRRRGGVSILNVQPDADSSFLGFAFAGDLYGWAIAVPHLFLIAVLLILPAWWLLVVRNRHEIEARREFGLCRHCGYDLRESPEVCPECGNQTTRAPALYAIDRLPAPTPSSPS